MKTLVAQAQELGLGESYNPRLELIKELGYFMSKWEGNDFIVGGYFNDDSNYRLERKGILKWLMVEYGLIDAHKSLKNGP